ncbi:hypothetical protein SORBI_3004G051166 [Sorghum bicolor]|uniref:Uncharacterized protein n=1 Tax=Sorghum bicolor TaxID=4558 RepID=A0A1Z5RLU2_SORBI|nr:hypothetical protein SORBI_3004G051166 [Sorghum bicolor]
MPRSDTELSLGRPAPPPPRWCRATGELKQGGTATELQLQVRNCVRTPIFGDGDPARGEASDGGGGGRGGVRRRRGGGPVDEEVDGVVPAAAAAAAGGEAPARGRRRRLAFVVILVLLD